ncbi:hypothetical protein [Kitasatospora sp. CB01950]|uniref:hypothetical protein n=1 Tax=Kitasatospora sp. CB01950 TaxID=1703930 RepID=UPI00093E8722|nr:hypothetical protein [Kitasatospora sp. CB01950]OKJ08151.1 hypothetical protein AMK19_19085 [Kitasatospora sp. CB01950]
MSSDRPTVRRQTVRRPYAAALSAALLLGMVLLLGTGGPARADSTPAGGSVTTVVDALRTGPIYVDPAFAAAVTAAQQKEIADRIAATGLPIKVVLVPLTKGDAFDGDPKSLAAVVNERLGLPQLILLTNDTYGTWLIGTEWPTDTHQVRDSANAVAMVKELKDAGLAARVGRAVELIGTGKGTEVYQAESERLDREYAARPHTPEPNSPSFGGSSHTPTVVAVAVVVVVLAGGLLLVRRRRSSRRDAAFALPAVVFAADRAADEAGLRRRAAAEVLALGEAVNGADGTTTPGLARALDAYDAAGRVLDGATDLADLAGVLALAAEGRAALATGPALPLCFFDPRHGTAGARTSWRPLGRRDRVDVAACPDCLRALRARRAPEALAVREQGRTVPYFEVPAERSLWAATGYGSLLSGPDDTLAARVGTGQFSRARHRSADPTD